MSYHLIVFIPLPFVLWVYGGYSKTRLKILDYDFILKTLFLEFILFVVCFVFMLVVFKLVLYLFSMFYFGAKVPRGTLIKVWITC